MPRGHELSENVWEARHRFMTLVAWVHIPGLLVVGLTNGFSFAHVSLEIGGVVGPLILARFARTHAVRAIWVSLALLSSSGILVHLTDGLIESHFHFFVVIPLVALYQDWRPFLVSLAFILVHHGLMGSLIPESVYNHPAALANPLLWAVIHAAYISGLVAVLIFHWKFAETANIAMTISEEQFRTAFQDAPIGMALVNLQGRFSQVNSALCRMLGYSAEQLTKLSIPEITHPGDLEATQEALRSVLDGEVETLHLEKRIMAADGRTVRVFANATLVRDQEGQPLHFIGQLVDISDLHDANIRLRDLLRSRDELIASVAHELRTPLTGVLGFAEVLRDPDSGLSPADRQEMITDIARQSADLSNIVEDLLTAARVEANNLKVAQVPVDLRAQAAQVLEALDQQAVVPIELSGRPVKAVGDPARVRQILRNLVTNSLRYGGETRKIAINQAGSSAQVKVCDNGPGIPQDKQYVIFEPYQRAHNDEGLTASVGLGLTVSRNLAKLMNGDLIYHRQDGETVFQLTLPLADSIDDLNDVARAGPFRSDTVAEKVQEGVTAQASAQFGGRTIRE